MKLKATRKQIVNNFSKIYLIDYRYRFLPDAFAYNRGYLGWNWDAYDLGGICLIEGYRNFPKHRRLPESAKQIIKDYEQESINTTLSQQEQIDKKYLDKFIKALLND